MSNVPLLRLHNLRLTNPIPGNAREIVACLGAVQAQDYAGAKQALGMRMQAAADADIEQAFTNGSILRTHVLRPT